MPHTHSSAKRYARLEARVTVDQKRLIEKAAQLKGTSVTDFIVNTMQQISMEAIRDFETMRLNEADQSYFIEALVHPPMPNKKLKKAAQHYKSHLNV